MRYRLKLDTKEYAVAVDDAGQGAYRVSVDGRTYTVAWTREGTTPAAEQGPAPVSEAPRPVPAAAASDGTVAAPIPGVIVEVNVRPGDAVAAGQTVVVMEAMKMENNLPAPVSGIVREVRVQKGAEVATGDILLRIERT